MVCEISRVSFSSAFSLDAEQPDYDLDSEDEVFVNKLKKKLEVGALQFEEMIDRLEKGSGQQVIKKYLPLLCELESNLRDFTCRGLKALH